MAAKTTYKMIQVAGPPKVNQELESHPGWKPILMTAVTTGTNSVLIFIILEHESA